MAQKRRVGGRVTPSKKQRAAAGGESSGPVPRRRAAPAGPSLGDSGPPESSRYTRPKPSYRLRPTWHRVAGWAGVVLGLVVVVLNDAMVFTDGVTLLPFGHQELYLMLGIAVAISSTWFLGLFDRGTTIYD